MSSEMSNSLKQNVTPPSRESPPKILSSNKHSSDSKERITNKRLSILSNTSASVRQKSFDLSPTARNFSESKMASASQEENLQNLPESPQSSMSSLYSAQQEIEPLIKRTNSVKKNPKNLHRSSGIAAQSPIVNATTYPLTRRTSVLQKHPKDHKRYINAMSPVPNKAHPLFKKQKRYKFVLFKRAESRRMRQSPSITNKNAAFANKKQLYDHMDKVYRNGSIRRDILPNHILNFGYNFPQGSIHRYYGVENVQLKKKKNRFSLQRSVSTKKKPRFVFPKRKNMTREQRKELIKSQISMVNNDGIKLDERYKNFIDLTKNSENLVDSKDLRKMADDSSSIYSVQLITNSKVVKSPTIPNSKKRNINNKNVFFQLLQLNPELRSEIKCPDFDTHDNFVLKNPSLQYQTNLENGLNYGFHRKKSSKSNTSRGLQGHKSSDEFNAIINDDDAVKIKSSSGSNSGSNSGQPQAKAQVPGQPQPQPAHQRSSSMYGLLSGPSDSNVVEQKVTAMTSPATRYDSPITYDFPLRQNIATSTEQKSQVPLSATSTHFKRDYIRRSVISSSSVDNETEKFYTPTMVPEVPDAAKSNESLSEIVEHHNEKVLQQRVVQSKIERDPAVVSPRSKSETSNRNTLQAASVGRNMAVAGSTALGMTAALRAQSQTDSRYKQRHVAYVGTDSETTSPPSSGLMPQSSIELVPYGMAKKFEKKRKSMNDPKIKSALKHGEQVEKQMILDHAIAPQKRKSKLILGGLFGSSGKPGLKGNAKQKADSTAAQVAAAGATAGAIAGAAVVAGTRKGASNPGSKRNSLVLMGGKKRSSWGKSKRASTGTITPAVSSGLGIGEAVSNSGSLKTPVSAGSGATLKAEKKIEQLATPRFEEFIDNKEQLVNRIESNSSVNLQTTKPKDSDSRSTLKANPRVEEYSYRVTNISAEEYKRYSDLFEQNKDKVINPDYVISDQDEQDLLKELNSFDPLKIQEQIQLKLAETNGLSSEMYRNTNGSSHSQASSVSSKEKFYARRNYFDNAQKVASTAAAATATAAATAAAATSTTLNSSSGKRSSANSRELSPDPALAAEAGFQYSKGIAPPSTGGVSAFMTPAGISAFMTPSVASPVLQTSEAVTAANVSGDITNETPGQYEVWGQYMKKIVNQRISYRLQNSAAVATGVSGGGLGSSGSNSGSSHSGSGSTSGDAIIGNATVVPVRTVSSASSNSKFSYFTASSELERHYEGVDLRNRGKLPISYGKSNLSAVVGSTAPGSSGSAGSTGSNSAITSPGYGVRSPPAFINSATAAGFSARVGSSGYAPSATDSDSPNPKYYNSSSSSSKKQTPKIDPDLAAIKEMTYSQINTIAHSGYGSERSHSSTRSRRSHSSRSKRSNDSISIRSIIGNKEIQVSLGGNDVIPNVMFKTHGSSIKSTNSKSSSGSLLIRQS